MTVREPSPSTADQAGITASRGRWILWAIYLAMSWTWCIGMFLPVLLIREYGILGWIVFMLPNVMGAAAMGFVIRRREISRDLILAHAPAMICFSIVTCAFQIFFGLWMFARLTPIAPVAWLVPVLASALAAPVLFGRDSHARVAAVLVLGISILCAVLMQRSGWLERPAVLEQDLWKLLWILPVSCFGFLACPYLDLTFHGVRMRLGTRDAIASFGIGFGAIFAVVLIFTLLYSTRLDLALSFGTGSSVAWIMIYFLVQLAFTTGIHWQRVTEIFAQRRWSWLGMVVIVSMIIAWLAWFASGIAPLSPEAVYRIFIGFYGLVFPGYVWLCLLPSPRVPPTRQQVLVLAVAIVIALPAYWIGFVRGNVMWLGPGLAVLLLARLAIRRRETLG